MRLDRTEQVGVAAMAFSGFLLVASAIIDFSAFVDGAAIGAEELGMLAEAFETLISIPTSSPGWMFATALLVVIIIIAVVAVMTDSTTYEKVIRGATG